LHSQAGKRLDEVLPKPCRASEVDQHNVAAKSDKEGVASEEGSWVAGAGPAVRYQDSGMRFCCTFWADELCFYRLRWLIAGSHLKKEAQSQYKHQHAKFMISASTNAMHCMLTNAGNL